MSSANFVKYPTKLQGYRDLAKALDLDMEGTIKVLNTRILNTLAGDLSYYDDERFSHLYVTHKPLKPLVMAQAPKNSAQKAQADEVAKAATTDPPTGCVPFILDGFSY